LPQLRHIRRCSQRAPIFKHSSQPCSGSGNSVTWTLSRCEQAAAIVQRSRPAAPYVLPSYAAAESDCQRWNAFPSLSWQAANQPWPGTGALLSASPPSSRTFADDASMSSVAK
jgi:hypothetical protein